MGVIRVEERIFLFDRLEMEGLPTRGEARVVVYKAKDCSTSSVKVC